MEMDRDFQTVKRNGSETTTLRAKQFYSEEETIKAEKRQSLFFFLFFLF